MVKNKPYSMLWKCSKCNKFAKIVDRAMVSKLDYRDGNFVQWCEKCLNLEIINTIKYANRTGLLPNYFIKPNFIYDLAEKLQFVLVRQIGSDFTVWIKKTDKLPKDYEFLD